MCVHIFNKSFIFLNFTISLHRSLLFHSFLPNLISVFFLATTGISTQCFDSFLRYQFRSFRRICTGIVVIFVEADCSSSKTSGALLLEQKIEVPFKREIRYEGWKNGQLFAVRILDVFLQRKFFFSNKGLPSPKIEIKLIFKPVPNLCQCNFYLKIFAWRSGLINFFARLNPSFFRSAPFLTWQKAQLLKLRVLLWSVLERGLSRSRCTVTIGY